MQQELIVREAIENWRWKKERDGENGEKESHDKVKRIEREMERQETLGTNHSIF